MLKYVILYSTCMHKCFKNVHQIPVVLVRMRKTKMLIFVKDKGDILSKKRN